MHNVSLMAIPVSLFLSSTISVSSSSYSTSASSFLKFFHCVLVRSPFGGYSVWKLSFNHFQKFMYIIFIAFF